MAVRLSVEDILPYSAKLDKADKPFPFAVQYRKNGFELCFIAADHEFSRQSKTHLLTDRCFAEFHPQAVILVGLTTNSDITWDQDIEDFFVTRAKAMLAENSNHLPEPYHALLKAKDENCIIYSGEPSEKALQEYAVAQGYSIDDYAGKTFLWMIGNWRKEGLSEHDLPGIWARHIGGFKDVTKLTKDFASFRAWFENRTGDVFALELIDNYYVAPDLSRTFGTLGHLSGVSSHFRDQTILKTIEAALHDHQRVLVVYGGSHYWTLKPALDQALGDGSFKQIAL